MVELNWILFDKSHRTPVVISIPRDLYERSSQHCRPLFIQPLREEYDVVTAPGRILFWTVGGKSFFLGVSLLNLHDRRRNRSRLKLQQEKGGQPP